MMFAENKDRPVVTSETSPLESLGFLSKPGLSVRFNPEKDGNCQFAAACDQLSMKLPDKHPLNAWTLRQEVVSELICHPQSQDGTHLENFSWPVRDWEKYTCTMKQNGTFGDATTLCAIAKLYSVQIVVLSTLGHEGTRVFMPVPGI